MKLQRSPRFREALVTAEDGTRPIVIALLDDTVQRAFRLVDAAGGTATLIAPGGLDDTWELIPVTPDKDSAPVADDECPLHPNTHVDMLITYLRRQDQPVRCNVVAPDHGLGIVQEFAGA